MPDLQRIVLPHSLRPGDEVVAKVEEEIGGRVLGDKLNPHGQLEAAIVAKTGEIRRPIFPLFDDEILLEDYGHRREASGRNSQHHIEITFGQRARHGGGADVVQLRIGRQSRQTGKKAGQNSLDLGKQIFALLEEDSGHGNRG